MSRITRAPLALAMRIAFLCAREGLDAPRLGPALKRAFGGPYIANQNFSIEAAEALLAAGKTLLARWRLGQMLITLGEEGMLLLRPGQEPYHTPTRAREVYDVSGAGDTAIAFFTAALAAGLDGPEAAEIANHAAGIVVGKLGTATVQPAELRESLLHAT